MKKASCKLRGQDIVESGYGEDRKAENVSLKESHERRPNLRVHYIIISWIRGSYSSSNQLRLEHTTWTVLAVIS